MEELKGLLNDLFVARHDPVTELGTTLPMDHVKSLDEVLFGTAFTTDGGDALRKAHKLA